MPFLWATLACTSAESAPVDVPPVDIARPEDGWVRGDLHFHTNYSDDAREQQGDWMGPALAIADAWRDPVWQAAFPQYATSDHLDFVAVTDHRTDAGWDDPAIDRSPLPVLRGEEFGADGHAGVWGASAHLPHEPRGSESPNARIQDAIDEAHAQGALFSVNHPAYAGDLWAWDVRGFDGVEVWNGAWSALGAPADEATLDAWVAAQGVENPWIRTAVRTAGVPQNGQALRFWQEMLSTGHHPAPVGGGDRHMIFPAGLPTTYVAASPDPASVLSGIAAGATFVSRGPQGPQVLLTAEGGGERYAMGAQVAAGEVRVSWRVSRARGGELRLVGRGSPDPVVRASFPLDGDDVSGTFDWSAAPGDWLHAVVVDPLPVDVPPDRASLVEALLVFPAGSGIGAVLAALGPIADLDVLGDPTACDPTDWDEWSACCVPADTAPYGTVYLPDPIQRLMSAEFRDGLPTGYAMGAISAAFVAR